MKKILAIGLIVISLCFAFSFVSTKAQVGNSATSQNDMLQQYLQSKQQQAQQAQVQQTQQTQQNQNSNTQSKSGLSAWEIVLLVVYSVTILLAWTNLILGIVALTRWLKQKKAQAAMVGKRLM